MSSRFLRYGAEPNRSCVISAAALMTMAAVVRSSSGPREMTPTEASAEPLALMGAESPHAPGCSSPALAT